METSTSGNCSNQMNTMHRNQNQFLLNVARPDMIRATAKYQNVAHVNEKMCSLND